MDLLDDFDRVRATFVDQSQIQHQERFDSTLEEPGNTGPQVVYDLPALSLDVTVRQASR